MSECGTKSEISRNRTCKTCDHPEHHKLRGTIKLLDEWANYQQAEHIHQQVQQVDMNKHRRDHPPPLIIRSVDQLVELGAIRDQDRIRKSLLQNSESEPARFPHQHEDEEVCNQKRDGEFVGTIEDSASEPDCFLVWLTMSLVGYRLCCGRCSADGALSFSCADDCPATTAHCWPAGASWVGLTFRQDRLAHLFQHAHKIVGVFLFDREDSFHHASRGRIVVSEITDHLAITVDRNALGHEILLDHVSK